MKKTKMFVAMLLVLLSALSITLPAMAAYSTMYVNVPVGQTVNLRKTASTSGTVLAKPSRGTAVQAEYSNSTWHKVQYNGISGYIMSEFLSTSNPNGSGGSDWASRYGSGTIMSQSNTGGATAGQIMNLQDDLNYVYSFRYSATLPSLDVDGLYGPNSSNRVRDFQGREKLTQDGYAGQNTKTTLFTLSKPWH